MVLRMYQEAPPDPRLEGVRTTDQINERATCLRVESGFSRWRKTA
jgi:hypothetical protein